MLFEAAATTHRHVHRRREMNIVRLVLNLLGIKGKRLCHVLERSEFQDGTEPPPQLA
jgi:hypothetical protein